MSIRFGSYSGIIVTVLSVMLVTGCSKRPPLQPDMQTTEGRMGPAESAQTESLAMQRERERQAAIEERERQVAEESMRRRIADTQSPMMSQEDFVNQDVHFAYDSHILNEEAKALLERKATWLDQHSQIKFQIEGHCDERGTTVYNLVLGERRAHAVKQYLTALGISASRISVISYGEEFPLDPGHTEDAWARNRRAHFVITRQ
jgi:peptidoglycan-associated lipoprotein